MQLLTVRQVAELLGLSSSTVYSLCDNKQLRHERLGLGRGVIRIPDDAITEYREKKTVIAGEARLQSHARREPQTVKLRHLDLSD